MRRMNWLTRLVRTVTVQTYLVYELPLDWHFPSTITLGNSTFETVWANEAAIKTLFKDEPNRMKMFLKFLSRGYIGIFHFSKDRWASYAWMVPPRKPQPPHLPSVVRKLNAYWIFFCRTRDEFQGQGLYKRSIALLAQKARQADASSRVFIDTAPDNMAAQRAIVAVGFESQGEIKTLNIRVPKIKTFVYQIAWRKLDSHEENSGFAKFSGDD